MSSDSEEDFVSFGTPLEPLEEAAFKPLPQHAAAKKTVLATTDSVLPPVQFVFKYLYSSTMSTRPPMEELKSVVYRVNRRGHRTVPCGAPMLMGVGSVQQEDDVMSSKAEGLPAVSDSCRRWCEVLHRAGGTGCKPPGEWSFFSRRLTWSGVKDTGDVSDEPLKKPVPLHEQTVKDEKGRYQRFHGAFTGGFSAGYFNTVGTKEGWAPSTFVSSRQQKAEKQQARPEDFMDDEDFGEHGIAPREITTSQEFWSSRRDEVREKARAVNAQNALIPGDTLLEELIAPARLSIGVELLRKMGWKEGQGVGPRVKRKARRQQADGGSRVYGCVLPPAGSEDSQDGDDDDEEFAPDNVTFAPKDVTPVDFTPKVGVQGLGYRGLDPGLALLGRGGSEHIDLFRPKAETRRLFGDAGRGSRRGGVAGQAFGVGALEDDDEDVYHKDSMSRYDKVLGGEEPGDGLYGWTAPQQYTKKRDKNKDAAYLGKILEGFTLAQKAAEEKTIFPPPSLPRDYRPVHHFRPSLDVSVLSGVSPALAEALRVSRGHMVKEEPQRGGGGGGGGRHQMDSDQRRTLLGEDALQGPSSVMELLRPEDRQRLLNLRSSSSKPATPVSHDALRLAGSSAVGGGASSGLQQEALAAWKGVQMSSQTFRPFEKNPSKQARYELYLTRLKQGDRDALEQSLDPAVTEWERSREREEFVRASILYRPTSSSLSSPLHQSQTGGGRGRRGGQPGPGGTLRLSVTMNVS
ncbi:G patch domain-containing protein 1 [Collichthys lucidus]|uniref:G patch domain-containing protein 1 n=1 Tax=Collichthys lucidus TaxID=240159 RepID=A0A4U5TW66_COLLU|nr:G patch domain-containing protein 1 [Collichthys lucidus]